MNRAQRRMMMKTIPGYKDALKDATEKAVEDLEQMFKKQWDEDDETLNDGDLWNEDDGEDDIYND